MIHPLCTLLAATSGNPYETEAAFAIVMLLSALVLVVFMRPGSTARIIIGVPFSLFILAIASIPLLAATGFALLDFSLTDAPSPAHSTLRLAAELLCYAAAYSCIPWLYVGKDALIAFCASLLTRR